MMSAKILAQIVEIEVCDWTILWVLMFILMCLMLGSDVSDVSDVRFGTGRFCGF
jgi:hypothetical protein